MSASVKARYREDRVIVRRSGSTEPGVSLDTGDDLLHFAPEQASALLAAAAEADGGD
jgi:hypothetical protein